MDARDIVAEVARAADVRLARGAAVRSIKCVVVPCTFEGRSAVIKWLARDEPPWRHYFAREIAMLAKLATPLAPRLLHASLERGFLVMTRAPGRALAATRHRVTSDRDAWGRVIRLARGVRALSAEVEIEPSARDTRAMRARLLEDPSAPIAWITEGLEECARRGILDAPAARALVRAPLRAAFQHGDLLLRNIVGEVVVDWECAGHHADGWDAALLAVFAPRWAREELAKDVDPACFRACFAFALAREIAFRRGKRDAITARLCGELDEVLRFATSP